MTLPIVKQSKPPEKCPECGHNNFMELKPESGIGFVLECAFFFILDLFARGPVRSYGLETTFKRHPGWMCTNCGWESRIKR